MIFLTNKRYILNVNTPVIDYIMSDDKAAPLVARALAEMNKYIWCDITLTDNETGELIASVKDKDEGGIDLYFSKEHKDFLFEANLEKAFYDLHWQHID